MSLPSFILRLGKFVLTISRSVSARTATSRSPPAPGNLCFQLLGQPAQVAPLVLLVLLPAQLVLKGQLVSLDQLAALGRLALLARLASLAATAAWARLA